MTNDEKSDIRELIKKLAIAVDYSICADKNYILLLLKKMYAVLGLRAGKQNTDCDEEFQEWLELMAWCEMWSMIAYQDLTKKNNQILANFTKLREDIRQGMYLEKND